MRMKDVEMMPIESIIRLPFFFSLERQLPDIKGVNLDSWWKIVFHCNKVTNEGNWCLLDIISDSEYVVRYKLMDFNK
jgi:hypothetical protein